MLCSRDQNNELLTVNHVVLYRSCDDNMSIYQTRFGGLAGIIKSVNQDKPCFVLVLWSDGTVAQHYGKNLIRYKS